MARTPALLSLLLLLPLSGWASTQNEARLGLHLAPLSKDPCGSSLEGYACDYPNGSNLRVRGDLHTFYHLYVLALDLDPDMGIGGMGFALDVQDPGTTPFLTQVGVCADVEYPTSDPLWKTVYWSASQNCQQNIDPADPQGQAVALAFTYYVYAYADASILGRYGVPFLVYDCQGEASYPPLDHSGAVQFGEGGGSPGVDPCAASLVPVESTTWGRVKRTFVSDPD